MVDYKKIIYEETQKIILQNSNQKVALDDNTIFLSGEIPFDSLDLATLIVKLEGMTGLDPFRDGFKNFKTIKDLAQLYEDSISHDG